MILWLAIAWAGPAEIPVDEAVQHATNGLATMGVTRRDLSFSKDYVNGWGLERDIWRSPGVDHMLHDPMAVPADAARLAQALRTDHPGELLLALAGAPPPADRPTTPCELKVHRALRTPLCEALNRIADIEAERSDLLEPIVLAVIEGLLDLEDPESEGDLPFTEYAAIARERLEAAARVDPDELANLGVELAWVAAELEEALADLPPSAWPRRPRVLEHEGQVLILGTPGSESLAIEGATLVLDPGGDDAWSGTPAATSALIDLDGDDRWHGAGSATKALTVVIDADGDDVWTGDSPGPAGALFGVAVVVDRRGDDEYAGRSWTQGGAEHGVAVLADLGGNDRYVAAIRGQGYGGVQGIGALVDRDGHDVYRIGGVYTGVPHYPTRTHGMGQGMSMGLRPLAGGGLGILHDAAGDDHYTGDLFSQGVSYWLGRGYLVDSAGDDVYSAHQYAQGVGVHLGVGALLDGSGDDRYTMRGLGLGSAHDYAVGWLVEGGGDDMYAHQDDSGVLGVGITNGVGFAVDLAGDDWQPLRTGPRASFTRGHWGASVFVDASGNDPRHGFPKLHGGTLRPSAASTVVDLDGPLPFQVEVEVGEWDPDAPTEDPFLHPDLGELGQRVDAACAGGGFATAEDWVAAVPVLARDHLGDGYCLEGALGAFLESEQVRSAIVEASVPQDRLSGRWLPRWLARLGPHESTGPALERLANSTHPMVRKEVALAQAELGIDDAVIDALGADRDVTVRAAAVHAMDRLDRSPDQVAPLLNDEFAAVRFNAAAALADHPDRQAAAAATVSAWADASPVAKWTIVYVAAELGVLSELDPGDDPVLDWHFERARAGERVPWGP